jgi:hypothetical protein
MFRWTMPVLLALALVMAVPCPAPSCSLCGGYQNRPTFREEAAQSSARLILYGTFTESEPGTVPGSGKTTMRLDAVLRPDPWLEEKKVVELPRYQPVDKKNPPQFLVFCDIYKGKIDPYRGVPMKNAEGVEYVKKAIALGPKHTSANLEFFFRYLEHPDKEIAADAFLEFAKASDRDIGEVAAKLSPEKLRGWLKNPQTPVERLGVYAFLLGACGGQPDAVFLEGLLRDRGERTLGAYDGILSGYMRLEPKKGWELAAAALKDGKEKLPVRLAVVRAVRFHQNWQPKENRAHVVKCLDAMLTQGELADVAVEELRRLQIWDLTRAVLALYGKKGYDAPIVQRTILRYALCCTEDSAVRQFLAERRRTEPELVKEVEESLAIEKK